MHHRETPRATVKLQKGCEEGVCIPQLGAMVPDPSGCQSLGRSQNPPSIFWNDDPCG